MGVAFDVKDHVARVSICCPDRLNAIDQDAEKRLDAIWREVEANRNIWVIVLTGEGDRAFCTGVDLKGEESGSSSLDYWASDRPSGFGGLSLRSLNVPVIARVSGYALGGGMEMALACDIVVASDTSSFGLPEPRVGRVALDGGIFHLSRKIPRALAMELLLTGRRISAQDAWRMGLVNEVVPLQALDEAVDRWVSDIKACAPLPLRAIKAMIREGDGLNTSIAHKLRVPELIEALQSEDQHEGTNAFLEKRKPIWAGR